MSWGTCEADGVCQKFQGFMSPSLKPACSEWKIFVFCFFFSLGDLHSTCCPAEIWPAGLLLGVTGKRRDVWQAPWLQVQKARKRVQAPILRLRHRCALLLSCSKYSPVRSLIFITSNSPNRIFFFYVKKCFINKKAYHQIHRQHELKISK